MPRRSLRWYKIIDTGFRLITALCLEIHRPFCDDSRSEQFVWSPSPAANLVGQTPPLAGVGRSCLLETLGSRIGWRGAHVPQGMVGAFFSARLWLRLLSCQPPTRLRSCSEVDRLSPRAIGRDMRRWPLGSWLGLSLDDDSASRPKHRRGGCSILCTPL